MWLFLTAVEAAWKDHPTSFSISFRETITLFIPEVYHTCTKIQKLVNLAG